MNTSKLFFISGVSSGFGRAIAMAALSAGHQVVGTVRDEEARRLFDALQPGRAHARLLDITQFERIEPVVAEVEASIGPIDVLINNAGYGHEGIMEESPIQEMRRQFDVNVFGAVALAKAVIPGMRQRRAGRIVNITSMGGFITMPGIAYYCVWRGRHRRRAGLVPHRLGRALHGSFGSHHS
jgi:NAD(P)-dependent dehydrogenase (short-subunit alcohol dehydrogenase family)